VQGNGTVAENGLKRTDKRRKKIKKLIRMTRSKLGVETRGTSKIGKK